MTELEIKNWCAFEELNYSFQPLHYPSYVVISNMLKRIGTVYYIFELNQYVFDPFSPTRVHYGEEIYIDQSNMECILMFIKKLNNQL